MTNQATFKICAILWVTALVGQADETTSTSISAHRALDGIYRVVAPDFEGFTQVQLIAYFDEKSASPGTSVIIVKVASHGEKPTIEQFQASVSGRSIVSAHKDFPKVVISEKNILIINGNMAKRISE